MSKSSEEDSSSHISTIRLGSGFLSFFCSPCAAASTETSRGSSAGSFSGSERRALRSRRRVASDRSAQGTPRKTQLLPFSHTIKCVQEWAPSPPTLAAGSPPPPPPPPPQLSSASRASCATPTHATAMVTVSSTVAAEPGMAAQATGLSSRG